MYEDGHKPRCALILVGAAEETVYLQLIDDSVMCLDTPLSRPGAEYWIDPTAGIAVTTTTHMLPPQATHVTNSKLTLQNAVFEALQMQARALLVRRPGHDNTPTACAMTSMHG